MAFYAGVYLVLILGSAVMVLPVFSMLSTALKSTPEVYAPKPTIIPSEYHWENFRTALRPSDVANQPFDFLTCLRNSLCVTGLCIIGNILSCSLVAWGFARFPCRLNRPLFAVMLSAMMLPPIVLSIPSFVMYVKYLNWYDTLYPLWVPSFFGVDAFFIFLLYQFFRGIPKDLLDAARMDGCSELGTFFRIVLPLSRPALMVVGVFTFIWTWNDFFSPLLYLEDPDKYTLALGLQRFITGSRGSQFGIQWNLLLAAASVVSLPIIVVFFIGPALLFIEGITLSGIKQ